MGYVIWKNDGPRTLLLGYTLLLYLTHMRMLHATINPIILLNM